MLGSWLIDWLNGVPPGELDASGATGAAPAWLFKKKKLCLNLGIITNPYNKMVLLKLLIRIYYPNIYGFVGARKEEGIQTHTHTHFQSKNVTAGVNINI